MADESFWQYDFSLYCSLYVLYFQSVNIDKQPAKLLFKSQEVSVHAPLLTSSTAGKSGWQHWIRVKLEKKDTKNAVMDFYDITGKYMRSV